jgi:hypothetical protein
MIPTMFSGYCIGSGIGELLIGNTKAGSLLLLCGVFLSWAKFYNKSFTRFWTEA